MEKLRFGNVEIELYAGVEGSLEIEVVPELSSLAGCGWLGGDD